MPIGRAIVNTARHNARGDKGLGFERDLPKRLGGPSRSRYAAPVAEPFCFGGWTADFGNPIDGAIPLRGSLKV